MRSLASCLRLVLYPSSLPWSLNSNLPSLIRILVAAFSSVYAKHFHSTIAFVVSFLLYFQQNEYSNRRAKEKRLGVRYKDGRKQLYEIPAFLSGPRAFFTSVFVVGLA